MSRANLLRVYLDIDGTILYYPSDESGSEELDFQFVCDGLEAFLHFVSEHCEPYWLSLRSRLGRTAALEERLFPHLPAIASTIPAAYWETTKSEAFDPGVPFVWFDDDPEPRDEQWLEQHGLISSLVRVDHEQTDKPKQMLNVVKQRLAMHQT